MDFLKDELLEDHQIDTDDTSPNESWYHLIGDAFVAITMAEERCNTQVREYRKKQAEKFAKTRGGEDEPDFVMTRDFNDEISEGRGTVIWSQKLHGAEPLAKTLVQASWMPKLVD